MKISIPPKSPSESVEAYNRRSEQAAAQAAATWREFLSSPMGGQGSKPPLPPTILPPKPPTILSPMPPPMPPPMFRPPMFRPPPPPNPELLKMRLEAEMHVITASKNLMVLTQYLNDPMRYKSQVNIVMQHLAMAESLVNRILMEERMKQPIDIGRVIGH